MKKVLALLSSIFLAVSAQAYAADAFKVAVVNVQQILLQSSRVAGVNTKLQDQFKPRQEKLAEQQKSLQEGMDKLNNMKGTERDAQEKKLASQKASFLKDAGAFQKEVNVEQNKAMQSILSQLSGTIASIAKKDSYALVLDSQAVVYSSSATDVTKQVEKEFNKQ
jgi:outer membrane protein